MITHATAKFRLVTTLRKTTRRSTITIMITPMDMITDTDMVTVITTVTRTVQPKGGRLSSASL